MKLLLAVFGVLSFAAADVGTGYNYVSPAVSVQTHHALSPVKNVKHTAVSVSSNVPAAPVDHHHTVAHKPAPVKPVVPQQPTFEYVPPVHHVPAHVPAPVKVYHAPAPVKNVKHAAVLISSNVPAAPVDHHHTVAQKPAPVQPVVPQQPTYEYLPPVHHVPAHVPEPVKVYHAPAPVKHVKHTAVSVSSNVPVAPVDHHYTVAHKPAPVQPVVPQQHTFEYVPPVHHVPAHVPAPVEVYHAPAPVKNVKHAAVLISSNVPAAPVDHHHTVAQKPVPVQPVVPQQPTYEYLPPVHHVPAHVPEPVKVYHAPAPVKHVKHTAVSVSSNVPVAPVDHHYTVAHKPAPVQPVVPQQHTFEYVPPVHHVPAHVPAPVEVYHAPAPVKNVKHTAVSVSSNVPVAPVDHHYTVAHKPAPVQPVVPQQPTYEYLPPVHHVPAHVPTPAKVYHAPAPVKHVKHTAVSVSSNVPVAPVDHHHTVVSNAVPTYPVVTESVVPGHELTRDGYLYKSPVERKLRKNYL